MKLDFKKQLNTYSAAFGTLSTVQVPDLNYLMIDGHGDPNTSPVYADALAALFPLAYKVKFLSKAEANDYVVMPLEALWWSKDMTSFTSERDKSRWEWTLMNMVPDWITQQHLDAAREAVARKATGTALNQVRLERYREGLSVQTLHIGPYDDEGPVLEAMHAFILAHSLQLTGKHHEIYLSDVRRTPAPRLQTILRQPVTDVPAEAG